MVSLTEQQKKYYVDALKDAEEIVREAGWSRGTLMVSAIFEKIASPLFYVPAGEEKPEPPKPAPAAQPKPPAQPAGDREKKIAELKAMGYRETKNPDIFMLRPEEGAPSFVDIKTGRTWKGSMK